MHKEILSHILSLTSFCIILLRIAFRRLVLSIHFPMPLLVPSDGGGPEVVWGCAGLARGYPGVAWRVAWGLVGAALGWPGGGLGRFYYPGTIRELSGNYPGFCVSFLGWLAWAWLGLGEAGWGWVGLARAGWGWLGLAGAEIKS